MLEFRRVSFRYPRQAHDAVRRVSFSVKRGEFVGILGADDAGKTTLAKLCNGQATPTDGQVLIAGVPAQPAAARNAGAFRVGVVLSDPENQIVGATVEEDAAFGLGNLRVPPAEMRRRVDDMLERVGLRQYAKRAPHELSGGEQQKLCLAGVAVMRPDCLVLDEPLTFLDSRSRSEFQALLREMRQQGTTMLYLTSDLDELADAERTLLLAHGEIQAEASPQTLWNAPELLAAAGIAAPDLLLFRHRLRERGCRIRDDSLTPETIAQDVALFSSMKRREECQILI